ncbi:Signal transduction histidine kinase [Franzmannia pantelleriensis]|uniref:histidine kinase n=1 Tax=Franzmannia pantelleriensis TaxID=48727 RepID=A0A1G9JEY8_9GAMM|nr:hybrid sensor histidine kinase/response regulator [Halomonas pantelleriensis]SDL35776.1 Signal transduction histidine kinase [Halomonas pantelleriensis]
MACTSTRPSPGLCLGAPGPAEPDAASPASANEQALAEENARLRKVCAALIERVESSGVAGGAPYAAFEHAVLLAEQVRERTETLHRTLDELSQVNAELGSVNAKLREEITVRGETERRLRDAKAEAEAANLSKTKFLAAVSHDLLQPLNAARLFTTALGDQLEDPALPAESRRLVGHIGRSLKDVETLLGTLVDISRLDAGVLKPDVAPFAATELLDALADEYRQVAAARGLTLRYVAPSAVIDSDLALLARVVRNLLSNAIRYTQRGSILLGCRRRPEGLEIVVADTGSGIEDAQRDEIFLEFRRGQAGQQQSDRGLGLGLAIVDRISGMLGHRLALASTPGRGSRFSILVPYGQRPTPASNGASEALPGVAPLAGARIWVIDNDPAICEGMQALLAGWGCDVATGHSLAALTRSGALASGADALIVDYHLDEHQPDGFEVAAMLQRRFPRLPVVVITANHDATLKALARERGYRCLLKPLKPLRLKMALLQCVSTAPSDASG